MASQPQIIGLAGVQVVFVVDGLYYQTSATNVIGGLSADDAASLIATGDAVPQAESYLTQFPWLYVDNALQIETDSVGSNTDTIFTEADAELWA